MKTDVCKAGSLETFKTSHFIIENTPHVLAKFLIIWHVRKKVFVMVTFLWQKNMHSILHSCILLLLLSRGGSKIFSNKIMGFKKIVDNFISRTQYHGITPIL